MIKGFAGAFTNDQWTGGAITVAVILLLIAAAGEFFYRRLFRRAREVRRVAQDTARKARNQFNLRYAEMVKLSSRATELSSQAPGMIHDADTLRIIDSHRREVDQARDDFKGWYDRNQKLFRSLDPDKRRNVDFYQRSTKFLLDHEAEIEAVNAKYRVAIDFLMDLRRLLAERPNSLELLLLQIQYLQKTCPFVDAPGLGDDAAVRLRTIDRLYDQAMVKYDQHRYTEAVWLIQMTEENCKSLEALLKTADSRSEGGKTVIE